MTFDDIMGFHPDNPAVFNDIKEHINQIIPFVGAGISAFVYPCWTDFLTLCAEKLVDVNQKNEVLDFISKNENEIAADRLFELRGTANFIADIQNAFSIKKLNNPQLNIDKQAVYLLPRLFKRSILTTNYDKTLEMVYQSYNEYLTCGHPAHTEMLINKLWNNELCLYKFHGDIDEPNKIILGKKSYETAYAPGSNLINDLSKGLTNRPILFLGCSLKIDRTMNVMEQIMMPGMTHYAIVSCKYSEIAERSRELGNKYIRAILYPDSNHEALRIILEKLIEETDYEKYMALSYKESEKSPGFSKNDRFNYDSGSVKFFGRTDEMEYLTDFLKETNNKILWCAITGSGGSGKSRLAYEFKDIASKMHWDVIDIRSDSNLPGIGSRSRNILFIVDYVQFFAKQIGKWIEDMENSPFSYRIRIILIERQGKNFDNAHWVSQLKQNTYSYKSIEKTCYKKNFIYLEKLTDKDLKNIIIDYAKNNGKDMHVKQAGKLLTMLQKIDPQLCRPLYALFIADAWINEAESPLEWSREDVLNYVTGREVKRYKNTLSKINDTAQEAFLNIKVIATAINGISISDIKKFCGFDWRILNSEFNPYDINNELHKLDLITFDNSKDKTDEKYTVLPIQPDLIGEYFVIDRLNLLSLECSKALIEAIWKKPYNAAIFFSRAAIDYPDLIAKMPDKILEYLMEPNNDDDSDIVSINYSYLYFLSKMALVENIDIAKYAVNILKETIFIDEEDKEFTVDCAEYYANSLKYLSRNPKSNSAMDSALELDELLQIFPDNESIKIDFCEVLFTLMDKKEQYFKNQNIFILIESIVNPNLDIESFCEIKAEFLTNKNEIFGFNDTDLKSVEELSKTYPDNKLISLCYGALLGSSLYKIDSATYDDTMRKIESLFTANKEIEQLAIMFAGAAFFRPFHSLNNEIVPINNLNFFENSLQSTVNTFNLSPDILKRINEFFKKSQANYTMQRVYNINNIVLENIDDDKNYENNMAYLNDLNNIYKSHDILSLSLSDILNVAISCLPDDIKRYLPIPATHSFQEPTVATLIDSINKISKTYALFQSNGYIQLYYAYSLYFLILKQNNINNLEALEKMLRLIEDNDDNEFFATIFVGAITFCTQYMNGEKCFYYIDIIDKLYNTYFENEEIKIAYAQTLYFQLFKEDNHNSILKIMKKIERIHEENPVNQILGIIYVQSLFFQVYNLDFKKDTLKTENNLIYDALMDSLNDENQSLDGLLMTQINSLSDNTGDDNIEFLNALSVSLGSDNMKNILNAVFQNANDNIMLFEKAMVCLKSLLKNDSDNTLINILYYSAVNNYVLLQEDRKALLQKEDFFKILINGSPTGELFSQVYLGKLTLLSCDDDNDDNFKIMEIMEYIANIYPKNDMLAMIFAEFLSNLSDSEFLLMKFSPISKIRIIVKRFLSNEDIVRLYLYIIYKMNEYDVEIVQVKEDVNLIAEIMKLHADNGDFIEVCEYMLDILQNEDSFDNELLETNE